VRILFLLCAAAIVYGSLYPFTFAAEWPSAAALRDFIASWDDVPSRGDVLGNIVLFLPYGLLGRFIWEARRVAWSGLLLAALLQAAQFWVDGRLPQLQDVLWNGVGLTAGLLLARLTVVRRGLQAGTTRAGWSPPMVLTAFWIASIAAPFVPTIDLSQLLAGLKPLLRDPRLDLPHAFQATAAWLAVGCLTQEVLSGRSAQRLLLLGLATLSVVLELAIVGNALLPAEALGLVAGLLLWFWRGERTAARRSIAGLLLLGSVLWRGLHPFIFGDDPGPFLWLPFSGALIGAMLVNLKAILAKVFLYGASIWLLQGRRGRFGATTAATAAVTLAVEVGQAWTRRGIAEITDPLLAIALGLILAHWRKLR
jgi:glycopeptide antibiotics resistance protein